MAKRQPRSFSKRKNLKILAESVKNDEMIIISVTGAFGTGKSFLLNCLLLYLRHLEIGVEGDDGAVVDQVKVTF